MRRLNILRERGFGFWEINDLSGPVDLRIPFLEPGHSQE